MKKEDLVIGNTYVVTGETGTFHHYSVGDKVTYIRDDGPDRSLFERKSDGVVQFVHVNDVKAKEVKHNLRENYEVSIGNFILKLEGHGTTIPHLKLKAYAPDSEGFQGGFIGAVNLRAMAKQLKKWAKGLEANGA